MARYMLLVVPKNTVQVHVQYWEQIGIPMRVTFLDLTPFNL